MIYVAVNEDGELDAEKQKQLEDSRAKKEAAFEKAKQKMENTAAAAADDEKDDELKAAAADAKRIFEELDAARKLKQRKIEEGEEDNFSSVGVHVVRNTRESWIPGVLSGYNKLAAALPARVRPVTARRHGAIRR